MLNQKNKGASYLHAKAMKKLWKKYDKIQKDLDASFAVMAKKIEDFEKVSDK